MRVTRREFLALAGSMALTSCASPTEEAEPVADPSYPKGELVGEPTDYADETNWYLIPEVTHDVDTFFLYPSSYTDESEGAPTIAATATEPLMTQSVPGTYEQFAITFEESTNIFMPYYRQTNTPALMDIPGSRYTDESGAYQIETPGYADCQVDVERGTIVTTETRDAYIDTVAAMGVDVQLFGTKSLHGMDYGLWFVSIQRNIADRIAAYQAQ